MASYAEMLLGGGGGVRGGPSSSPRPIHEAPLNHVTELNENAVYMDPKVVKAEFSIQERNDFLLKDLGCKMDDLKGIFPDPSNLLLRVTFVSAALFETFLACLTDMVPWADCQNALVYGWAPGASVTAVRVSGVPECFFAEMVRDHFL